MLNKKILAASIAASLSMGAHAAVDLGDADTALRYATQTIVDGGVITAAAAIDVDVAFGLNLPADTVFYIRFELENATFATSDVAAGDLSTDVGGIEAIAVEGGGLFASDDDYVVFSYSSDTAPTSDNVLSFAFGTGGVGLTVTDTDSPVTVTYKLYEADEALAALNGGAGEVASDSLAAIDFVTGQDVSGTFTATNLTALVSSQFTEFSDGADADTANDTITSIGEVAYAVVTGVLAADDSAQVAIADVYTTSSDATLGGDFSFGTWTFQTAADCTGGATALTVDENDSSVATTDAVADFTSQFLCVDVSGLEEGEVIPKVGSAYTVSLDDNTGVSGSLGTISYDTTSISIPHLTTFSNSNQKIYVINAGSTDASYTTTFRTEDGITAAGGTAATGTVPAGKMLQIKASDLVSFTNGTRGSATIEIEAEASNIQATSQLTNLVSKGSDITILTVQ